MKKTIIFCVCLILLGLFYNMERNAGNKNAEEIPAVKTIKVKPRQISLTYQTIGVVQPKQKAELRPQVDGVLTEILFNEGENVKQGQVLAKIDNRIFEAELDKAEADLAADEAKLKEISNNLKRFEKLNKSSVVSQKALEEQQSLYKQQTAQVKKNKEQVVLQRVNLEYTKIRAPFSGKVGLKQMDAGNFVRSSEEKILTTVVQTNPIEVVFSVSQELLPYLNKDSKLQVQALDRMNDKVLAQGYVSAVDNQIDKQSGTLEMKAEFSNDDILWSGEFVKIKLIYEVLENAMVLPNETVRPSLNGNVVYKVKKGKVQIESVETGYQNEKETVISLGVDAGDEIICDGFSQLANNADVKTEQVDEQ